MSGLSLATIDQTLEELVNQRQDLMDELAQAHDLSSPNREEIAAAIEQTDLALKSYAEDLRPAKADAYWWTIKNIGKVDPPQGKPHVGLIADAKREINRLKDRLEKLDALRSMLEQNVLDSLVRRGEKVLGGTNGRKLRRQNNGGALVVDVVQPELVPDAMQRVTVSMPLDLWRDVCHTTDFETLISLGQVVKESKPEPDLTAIREALERGEGVPGCVLKERGEHLRCS